MTAGEFDVIVVGAGPTGFTLAIDLGRRGVRVLLVERDSGTKVWPKMDRSNARTMEIFRRLGIADRVRALGYPPEASMDVFIVTRLSEPPLVRLHYPSVATHRSTIASCTDMSEPLEPYQLVSQNDLEPLLKEIAENTPNVRVEFGCELVSFEQDELGVEVVTRRPDGVEERWSCAYLAGCDGGRSMVRKLLGIALEGQGGLAELQQVVFRSENLYENIPIGQGRHYYVADDWNSIFVVQGGRKEFTFHGKLPADADRESAIRSRLGFDVDLEVRHEATWRLNLLLADRYRAGRVFIAGDAAHLMIPTGGLGMNTGIGDAIDLSWKLAGTIQGWAGEKVLASYEPERRSVGRTNVDAAGWAAEGMSIWRRLWSPDIDDPGKVGTAKREEIARAADEHHRRVHEMIGVELGYTYAGSDLVAAEAGNRPEWSVREYRPHTRPGIRLPHVWLEGGTAVQDVLGAGYSLLDLTAEADTAALKLAFAELGAPLDVVRRRDPHARDVYGCGLLLLRPDLHVYWRGDRLPADAAVLARAATGHRSSYESDFVPAA